MIMYKKRFLIRILSLHRRFKITLLAGGSSQTSAHARICSVPTAHTWSLGWTAEAKMGSFPRPFTSMLLLSSVHDEYVAVAYSTVAVGRPPRVPPPCCTAPSPIIVGQILI